MVKNKKFFMNKFYNIRLKIDRGGKNKCGL